MPRSLSHLVGLDDGPFRPEHRGNVTLIGAVFSDLCLVGVLHGYIRRDGTNATRAVATLVETSPFRTHLQGVLLQGIAFGGFNVVDIQALHQRLGLPVLVVIRRLPDLAAIGRALLSLVPGGRQKWRWIEQTASPELAAGVYVQRAGIEHSEAEHLIKRLAIHGRIPVPLRTAHLIANGITPLPSRQRV